MEYACKRQATVKIATFVHTMSKSPSRMYKKGFPFALIIVFFNGNSEFGDDEFFASCVLLDSSRMEDFFTFVAVSFSFCDPLDGVEKGGMFEDVAMFNSQKSGDVSL
jgi:hypothetical protein